MGEIARSLAKAAPLAVIVGKVSGKNYPFYRLTGRVKAAFEMWLENRARNKVEERHREGLYSNDYLYQAALDKVENNIDSGAYSWDEPICRRALNQNEGTIYIIYLLTVDGKPIIPVTPDQIDELTGIMKTLSADISADPAPFNQMLAKAGRADPNSQAPVEGPGIPSASANSVPSSSVPLTT